MSPNKLSLVLLIVAVVTANFGQTFAQVSDPDDDDFEQVSDHSSGIAFGIGGQSFLSYSYTS
jgi:hypothetical protein